MPCSFKAILACVFLVSFLAILSVAAPVQAAHPGAGYNDL